MRKTQPLSEEGQTLNVQFFISDSTEIYSEEDLQHFCSFTYQTCLIVVLTAVKGFNSIGTLDRDSQHSLKGDTSILVRGELPATDVVVTCSKTNSEFYCFMELRNSVASTVITVIF
ncbi:hypothetical protein XENTR_v10006557 [Xenopus tropicalis]|nr:hypothetical protein XENTR_v10006557 [Xenopus tropicalis]